MLRYLVNARNRAESSEQSRFPPALIEFCFVCSPRAGHIFEIGNFWLFLTWYFNPILKLADKTAILIGFGVLAKAM